MMIYTEIQAEYWNLMNAGCTHREAITQLSISFTLHPSTVECYLVFAANHPDSKDRNRENRQ
jgi:hypothetical protein